MTEQAQKVRKATSQSLARVAQPRKHREYGALHSSGMNRHQRREEEATKRLKPMADKRERAEDHKDLLRAQKAAAVLRKATTSHQRAQTRKEMASGKPRLITRAKEALRRAQERRAFKKKARAQTYQRKHASV